MNQMLCHNPACRRPVARRDAFLRSVSLQQVAFCSAGCVDVFDQLDKSARTQPVPEQRRPASRVRR
jgi:hypothetical protein